MIIEKHQLYNKFNQNIFSASKPVIHINIINLFKIHWDVIECASYIEQTSKLNYKE